MAEKTIYLAYTTSDMAHFRDDLMFTLFKAGFKVIPLEKAPENEPEYKNQIGRASCRERV